MSKAISLEEQHQHNHLLSVHFHLVLLYLYLLQSVFGSNIVYCPLLEAGDNYSIKRFYFSYIT